MILYLDSRMGKLMHYHESMLVIMSRIETLGVYTEHTGKLTLSDFPDMEVSDLTLSISLYLCSDFLYDHIIGSPIYEYSWGISHEEVGPAEYKDCPKYSHSGVEPIPSIVFCS